VGLLLLGVFLLTDVFVALTTKPAQAATSSTLNFQARLQTASGGQVADGFYNVEFKLYSASSGGSALWTETWYDSDGVGAAADNRVRVKNGYLTVNLGSLSAFPALNWDQEMWLTMNVGGTAQTATPTYDGEMNPRLKLTGVPYAFRAGELAKYNSATGFTSTLSLANPTVGNQTFTIPDQGAAGSYTLLTTNTANATYIQNTSSPQTANFNVTGNGTVGGNMSVAGTYNGNTFSSTALTFSGAGATSIQSASGQSLTIDSGTTAALNFGTGANAKTITIGNATGATNVTINSGTGGVDIGNNGVDKTINVGVTGTTANTTAVNVGTSTGAAQTIKLGGTNASGGSNSGSTVALQGGATALSVATAGTSIQTFTNSASAFQVTNSGGAAVFLASTTTSNLISNPGFEVNTTDWATTGTGTGLAILRETTKSNIYNGIASLMVVTASGTANSGATVTTNLAPGAYALSFYAKASGAFSTLNVTTTGGGAPACITGASLVTTGFKRFTCTFIGTTTNITAINFIDSSTSQHIFYLDAVQLTSGLTITPYNIGNIQLLGVISAPATFQSNTNSSTAFQIQNTAGTSNVFVADTINNFVGIGTATPGYKLDVNGDINVSSGSVYRVNGVQITSAALSNDSNLAKLDGTQTFTGANTFSNAANSFTGVGTGLTALNATNLGSGNVDTARIVGAYGNITGVGALTTGSIASGFGTISTTNNITTTTTVQGATVNATTGYQANGTAGLATLSCTGGQLLQNATVAGGIITAGSCGAAGGGSGVTSVGAFSATSIANGGSVSGTVLTLGVADGTNPGMVSTVAQTFAGAKTFTSSVNTSTGNAYQINGANVLAAGALSFTAASAATVQSAASQALNITGNAASTISTSAGNLTIQGGSGTVSLGTSTALTNTGALTVTGGTTLTLSSTGTNAATFDSGTTGAVNIASSASAKTVTIGNSTGTTSISLLSGTNGIDIGNNAVNKTIDVGVTGTTANTTAVNIATSTGAAQTMNIGGTFGTGASNASSVINMQGGAVGMQIDNGGVLVKSFTNSTTAFEIQDSAGTTELKYDTVSSTLMTNTIDTMPPVSGGTPAAIVRTNRTNGHSGGAATYGTGNFTPAGTFTPTANSVLIAIVSAGRTPGVGAAYAANGADLTISGGGLTWVSVAGSTRAVTQNTADTAVRAFYAVVGASPSAMQATVNLGGKDAYSYTVHIDEYTNVDTAAPVAGALNAGGRSSVDNETFTGTLAATPTAGDYKVGFSAISSQDYNAGANPTGYAVTAGWTQASNLQPQFGLEAQTVVQTGSTSTTLNWTMANIRLASEDNAYAGFIVKQSTAATTTTFNLTLGGTNAGAVQIGSSTTDAVAVDLILDSFNGSVDPTGVNGAMYYNSSLKAFRCYENSVWYNCISRHITVLGADVTNNNATANTIADVTGLSFNATAGTTYRFRATIAYTAAATTTGSRWSITGPATPTMLSYTSNYTLTATTMTINYASAYDIPAASNASSLATGNIAQIEGIIIPSVDGPVKVRFASEIASSAIIAKAGSTFEWW
jgi:hypothetical protein